MTDHGWFLPDEFLDADTLTMKISMLNSRIREAQEDGELALAEDLEMQAAELREILTEKLDASTME